MNKKNIRFRNKLISLFIGIIVGHIIGIIYSFILILVLVKVGELTFSPQLIDFLKFLLLKDNFTIFPQIISIIFGILIGYHFIEKRKIASLLALSLFCFFIIYIIFWYIVGVYIIGYIT